METYQELMHTTVSGVGQRVKMDFLTPAQRAKVLESKKLELALWAAETDQQCVQSFASIKWKSVPFAREMVLASGNLMAYRNAPLQWWGVASDSKWNSINSAFVSLEDNAPAQNDWLVNALLANSPRNMVPNQTHWNTYVEHFLDVLISQGFSADTQLHSTLIGGTPRMWNFSDLALVCAAHNCPAVEQLCESAQWNSSTDCENTLFALSAHMLRNEKDYPRAARIVRKLTHDPNWSRTIPLPNGNSVMLVSVVLSALIAAPSVSNEAPLAALRRRAQTALENMDASDQVLAAQQICAQLFGSPNNTSEKVRACIPYVRRLSAPAQQVLAANLAHRRLSVQATSKDPNPWESLKGLIQQCPTPFLDAGHLQKISRIVLKNIAASYKGVGAMAQASAKKCAALEQHVVPHCAFLVQEMASSLAGVGTREDAIAWEQKVKILMELHDNQTLSQPVSRTRKI